MTTDKALTKATELVALGDRHGLNFQFVALIQLGNDLYAASFDGDDLQKGSPDFEYWWEAADSFPRTATAETPSEAIVLAIRKTAKLEFANFRQAKNRAEMDSFVNLEN